MASRKYAPAYGYKEFRADFKKGDIKPLYVFFGEENYLLRDAVKMLRSIVAAGTEDFNLRRFEGKTLKVSELADAIDTLPMFSDKTLVEVWDYDFGQTDEDTRQALLKLFSELPEYVCVVFIAETVEFKLDGRINVNKEIKKRMTVTEFAIQGTPDLIGWIRSHVSSAGKQISPGAAEYLAVMTGGQMTLLLSEIDKLASYCTAEEITKKDIDAVVTPVLNTAVYEMMGKVMARDYDGAAVKLTELAALNEAPQRIVYDITSTLRQMLGARIFVDAGGKKEEYVALFEMNKRGAAFLADRYFPASKRLEAETWAKAVLLSEETAYMLNSAPFDGMELLSDLIVRLAVCMEAR